MDSSDEVDMDHPSRKGTCDHPPYPHEYFTLDRNDEDIPREQIHMVHVSGQVTIPLSTLSIRI